MVTIEWAVVSNSKSGNWWLQHLKKHFGGSSISVLATTASTHTDTCIGISKLGSQVSIHSVHTHKHTYSTSVFTSSKGNLNAYHWKTEHQKLLLLAFVKLSQKFAILHLLHVHEYREMPKCRDSLEMNGHLTQPSVQFTPAYNKACAGLVAFAASNILNCSIFHLASCY